MDGPPVGLLADGYWPQSSSAVSGLRSGPAE